MSAKKSGLARLKESRSREFDLIFGCLSDRQMLLRAVKSTPGGARVVLEGIEIEFGKVSSLVRHLNPDAAHWPFGVSPSHVCHLDNISADRKRALERLYGLTPGLLSARSSRADLFIIMEDGQRVLISVKDDLASAKLGQVSSRVTYGRAVLAGGMARAQFPDGLIPKNVAYTQTSLSPTRFAKLGMKDRECAFLKKNHAETWLKFVKESLEDADQQLKRFVDVITKDRSSFVSFVSEVTAGVLADFGEYYLLIGERLIRFSELLDQLKTSEYKVLAETYKPREKTSYIIWVELNGSRYCLTKIEPSFEGARHDTEQTKGIIFHFQQHLTAGNTYKKLFLDLIQ